MSKQELKNESVLKRPLQADSLKYYSQLHSFPWNVVTKVTCGITTATMAISLKHQNVLPLDVLSVACNLHQVPKHDKNYWVQATYDKQKIVIPVGTNIRKNMMENIEKDNNLQLLSVNKNNDNQYKPVFSLNTGYDHRGSLALFAEFGIKAEKLGDPKDKLSEKRLTHILKEGGVFMASVKSSVTAWEPNQGAPPTHVVLLTDVIHFKNEDWYYIVDPYSKTESKVVFLQPTRAFCEMEFSGYGTAIYVNEKTT